MFQGFGIAMGIETMTAPDGMPLVVAHGGLSFRLTTALTLTTGTIFLMWLGEKITTFGVGNGMSLIIMAGIIAGTPSAITKTFSLMKSGEMQIIPLIVACALMAVALVAIVFMETSQRRVPIQYVRKASIGAGSKGGASYLPLKLNPAGVIPIIFASTIVTLFPTIATFSTAPAIQRLAQFFSPSGWFYYLLELVFIVFFTYFYTSIIFNPKDIAENIQKSGGVVPGKRPGEATADYIDYVLSRLTFVGAAYLAIVAVMPQVIIQLFRMPFYFGGTSVLIVVGVGLDMMQKIESHLIANNYSGFLSKGRMRGRY
ncbi:protein translocase subunit SecY [Deferribacterales bacterium RsTz2092]